MMMQFTLKVDIVKKHKIDTEKFMSPLTWSFDALHRIDLNFWTFKLVHNLSNDKVHRKLISSKKA